MSITRDNNEPVILQERHYSPFGLLHRGYNETEYRITYDETEEDKIFTPQVVAGRYKYWYNGKEWQNDLELNLYDYGARQYDPAVGRWFVVDPLAEDVNQIAYSPYAYAWNNPTNLNDPSGKCPWCIGAVVGALTEYGVQVVGNLVEGKNLKEAFTDVDKKEIGLAAVAGATGVGIANALSKIRKIKGVANVISKSKIAQKIVNKGTEIVGDAVGSIVGSKIQGNEIEKKGIVSDIAFGQLGRGISKKINKYYKNSPEGKYLKRKAERLERLAGPGARQSRIERAKQARESFNNYGKTRAIFVGAVSSNAASKTYSLIKKTSSNEEINE